MPQPGSPVPTGPPATSQQDPAQITVIKPRWFLLGSAVAVLLSVVLFWMYGKVAQQGKQTDTTRGITEDLGKAFDEFRSDTTKKMEELPRSQEEYLERLRAVEQQFADAQDDLEILRQQSNEREVSNSLSFERTVGVHRQGELIREKLRDLGNKLAQWNVRQSALLSEDSKDGKRIAGVPHLLKQFMAIDRQPYPSDGDVITWQERLQSLITRVDQAYKANDARFTASDMLVARLGELEKEVDDALDQVERHQVTVSSILDQAPEPPPSEDGISLQEAIDEEGKKRAAEAARILAEELERAQHESAQKFATAKADAKRLIGEEKAKMERLLGEHEAQRLAELADDAMREERERLEQRKEQLARQQLEAEFQAALPEIRSLLTPFLSDGYTQPGRHGTFERTTEKGPVSFSQLKGSGLLDKNVDSIGRLHFATTANSINDRPYGSFPPQSIGSGERARTLTAVQRAQELLNKYGELLVEKEMLAP